jgi:asparagine synthetase B (glutamine-hydrolysing)
LRPEVSAAITNELFTANPNEAAQPLIKKEMLNDPRIYPSEEELGRSLQVENLGHNILGLPILHADRLWMAHGVEARLPFLDPPLVELLLRAPPETLATPRVDKPLLRRAARRLLPAGWGLRAKRGFSAAPGPPRQAILAWASALTDHAGIGIDSGALRALVTASSTDLSLIWRATLVELQLRVLDSGRP